MIKLALLKSGEEIISDMTEMMSGTDGGGQVVGYFLHHPCRAVLTSPDIQVNEEQESERKPVSIRLIPWMPLSKDERIPVVADWVISIVEPQPKLKEMYEKAVSQYEKRQPTNPDSNEQSEDNNSSGGSAG